MSKEHCLNMINSAKERDYLTFKQNFDELMKEKLDNHYENRTKQIYNNAGDE